jgi:hypothetical protein
MAQRAQRPNIMFYQSPATHRPAETILAPLLICWQLLLGIADLQHVT